MYSRWRWTFWLIVVAFLFGVLRVPASILELTGVLPAAGPTWYVLFQALARRHPRGPHSGGRRPDAARAVSGINQGAGLRAVRAALPSVECTNRRSTSPVTPTVVRVPPGHSGHTRRFTRRSH
jgi:hypothetical protein